MSRLTWATGGVLARGEDDPPSPEELRELTGLTFRFVAVAEALVAYRRSRIKRPPSTLNSALTARRARRDPLCLALLIAHLPPEHDGVIEVSTKTGQAQTPV